MTYHYSIVHHNFFYLCLGNIDSDIIFAFDADTEVDQSCSSTFNGEHFVIGGVNKKRQVYYHNDKTSLSQMFVRKRVRL